MDGDGYFTFSSTAARLALSIEPLAVDSWTNNPLTDVTTGKTFMRAEDGSVWRVCHDAEDTQATSTSLTLAVHLGKQEPYVNLRPGRAQDSPEIGIDKESSIGWREHYALAKIIFERLRSSYRSMHQEGSIEYPISNSMTG